MIIPTFLGQGGDKCSNCIGTSCFTLYVVHRPDLLEYSEYASIITYLVIGSIAEGTCSDMHTSWVQCKVIQSLLCLVVSYSTLLYALVPLRYLVCRYCTKLLYDLRTPSVGEMYPGHFLKIH